MNCLVVHGMFCRAWHISHLVARLKGHGLAAIALELPDRGGGDLTGLRDFAEFVKGKADSILREDSSLALVGHSMGGLICLLAAAELADRPGLKKLALLGCAAPAGVNGFTFGNLRAFMPAVLGTGRRWLMPSERYWQLFMNRQDDDLRRQAYQRLVPESRRLIRSIALPALDRSRSSQPRFAAPPRFDTMVLAAEGDRSTPPRVQRAVAGLLPRVRYESLRSPDHYGFIQGSGSEAVERILVEFLKDR